MLVPFFAKGPQKMPLQKKEEHNKLIISVFKGFLQKSNDRFMWSFDTSVLKKAG